MQDAMRKERPELTADVEADGHTSYLTEKATDRQVLEEVIGSLKYDAWAKSGQGWARFEGAWTDYQYALALQAVLDRMP